MKNPDSFVCIFISRIGTPYIAPFHEKTVSFRTEENHARLSIAVIIIQCKLFLSCTAGKIVFYSIMQLVLFTGNGFR